MRQGAPTGARLSTVAFASASVDRLGDGARVFTIVVPESQFPQRKGERWLGSAAGVRANGPSRRRPDSRLTMKRAAACLGRLSCARRPATGPTDPAGADRLRG